MFYDRCRERVPIDATLSLPIRQWLLSPRIWIAIFEEEFGNRNLVSLVPLDLYSRRMIYRSIAPSASNYIPAAGKNALVAAQWAARSI